ncbi:MAG: DUF6273 domain-containing protein, partial [Lachnospiraceae bacterium]|nr:DUF6273 domain-containing protein [Lachnospiraceae bacterium]
MRKTRLLSFILTVALLSGGMNPMGIRAFAAETVNPTAETVSEKVEAGEAAAGEETAEEAAGAENAEAAEKAVEEAVEEAAADPENGGTPEEEAAEIPAEEAAGEELQPEEIQAEDTAAIEEAGKAAGEEPEEAEAGGPSPDALRGDTKAIAGLAARDTIKDYGGGNYRNYVYYGAYGDNGQPFKPVKYRVLDSGATEFGGTSVLLDCVTILTKMMFDDDEDENDKPNVWADSTLKAWLNGDEFLDNSGVFTEAERAAIAKSVKPSPLNDGSGENYYAFVPLTGEKIFILDFKEATRKQNGYSYGFEDKDNLIKGNSRWWLRSNYYRDDVTVASVNVNGDFEGVNSNESYTKYGVSPTFNIAYPSIIFTSLI